jgi:hypothetical protein
MMGALSQEERAKAVLTGEQDEEATSLVESNHWTGEGGGLQDHPKSQSLATLLYMSKFYGFMSRWKRPFLCMLARPL